MSAVAVHMQGMNASSPAADAFDDLPLWSLNDLYSSPEDPKIEADFEAARLLVAELAQLKGAIAASRANPDRLGLVINQIVSLYEKISNILGALGSYAGLLTSTARDNPAYAKLEGDLRTRQATLAADLIFVTLDINQIEDWELEAALRAHPEAAVWRPWLRQVRLYRAHELSADLEGLLLDKSPALANWTRLYDETLAGLKADCGGEILTLPEALNRLSDPSPDQRRIAAAGLALALEEKEPVLGLVLNTIAFEKQVEDRWRKYADPAQPRHLANEVDAAAVKALEEAVVEAYPRLSHRYYAIKARLMGEEALNYWDRNAPITQEAPLRYSWDEAKSVVLESFSKLSPAFAARAETMMRQPWIDARPRAGKSSGAYSHPVTADKHPYVFLNYMGERRDVLTLAHELGHAVHQIMAQPLGTLLASTPLTLAETASIFGEGLVFERLLAEAEPKDRLALLAGKIEDGLNTVVRQISFHRFETRFHDLRRQGEVSNEEIGKLWLEIMGESLGPAIRLNPGYEHYWAYVSHFVHAPFYVYAYAFGDLLVSALMEKRKADPVAFAPLYETLLAGGGSKTYVEALAPFGLDPREKAFWAQGCDRLAGLIEEFDLLSRQHL